MDADGENPRPLTSDRSLAATPCWGKEGREVYYNDLHAVQPRFARAAAGFGTEVVGLAQAEPELRAQLVPAHGADRADAG